MKNTTKVFCFQTSNRNCSFFLVHIRLEFFVVFSDRLFVVALAVSLRRLSLSNIVILIRMWFWCQTVWDGCYLCVICLTLWFYCHVCGSSLTLSVWESQTDTLMCRLSSSMWFWRQTVCLRRLLVLWHLSDSLIRFPLTWFWCQTDSSHTPHRVDDRMEKAMHQQ